MSSHPNVFSATDALEQDVPYFNKASLQQPNMSYFNRVHVLQNIALIINMRKKCG